MHHFTFLLLIARCVQMETSISHQSFSLPAMGLFIFLLKTRCTAIKSTQRLTKAFYYATTIPQASGTLFPTDGIATCRLLFSPLLDRSSQ